MRFEVIWTDEALKELQLIYVYYSSVSETAGEKIVERILSRAKQLSRFPFSGQEESLLKSLKLNHRYLVEGNYKLVFRVAGNVVLITDIFDTRKNPVKILKAK